MCYFADTVVFEATVAWTSYPAGITAFEPGMKIHGQSKIPVTTASGVRFLPFIRTSVFVKNTGSPDGKFMLLMFITSLPLVPANELLHASVTFPFTKYPRGITHLPSTIMSCVTLKSTVCPSSTSAALTWFTDCNGTMVPALITFSCCAKVNCVQSNEATTNERLYVYMSPVLTGLHKSCQWIDKCKFSVFPFIPQILLFDNLLIFII